MFTQRRIKIISKWIWGWNKNNNSRIKISVWLQFMAPVTLTMTTVATTTARSANGNDQNTQRLIIDNTNALTVCRCRNLLFILSVEIFFSLHSCVVFAMATLHCVLWQVMVNAEGEDYEQEQHRRAPAGPLPKLGRHIMKRSLRVNCLSVVMTETRRRTEVAHTRTSAMRAMQQQSLRQ